MCLKTTVHSFSWFFVVLATPMLLSTGCGWERDNPLDRKGVNERAYKDSAPPQDTTVNADNGSAEQAVGSETINPPDGGAPSPDAAVSSCLASIIGKKCTKNSEECGETNTCLLTSEKEGICTCSCTPDDSKTPLVNEDSCPGQPSIMCGPRELEVTSNGKKSKKNFCWKLCVPKMGSNPCDKPFVCHPNAGVQWGIFGKSNTNKELQSVCYYSTSNYGCAKADDCQISTGAKCTVAKKDCATGSKCEPWVNKGLTGICIKPGVCDTASGLCKPQKTGKTAKVGDPCKGDIDCGDNQSCNIEYDQAKDLGKLTKGGSCTSDSDCCSDSCTTGACDDGKPCTVQARNGYCVVSDCSFATTLTHAKCPTGSICNKLYNTGLCQKTCKMDAKTGVDSCRGNAADKMGDYECRGWNALAYSFGPIATGAVCDLGAIVTCSWFKPPAGSTSTMSCATLGTYSGTTLTNTTKMSCRDMKNTVLTDKYSKKGWCFDDTASGSVSP